MPGERLLRILSRFTPSDSPLQICQRSADLMDATGAGIVLMAKDLLPCVISEAFQFGVAIADLEQLLGEGPCQDAYTTGHLIGEGNLDSPGCTRWNMFASEAVTMGITAVFAFPLRMGSIRIGAMYFYRDQPGGLTDDQVADGFCLANSATRAILGTPIAEIRYGSHYASVHQAAGIASVQLGVSVAEGLIRVRAMAIRLNRPLLEVAEMIVSHQIRFCFED